MRWMSNADVRDELAALQVQAASARISIEEVGPAFERLAWSLVDVSRDDDAALREHINDIERIRFTMRPEHQLPAVADVLRRARPLFDRVS
jgi:hypothetical protein